MNILFAVYTKIIEKDFLDDDFIIKPFAINININDKIYFSKKQG